MIIRWNVLSTREVGKVGQVKVGKNQSYRGRNVIALCELHPRVKPAMRDMVRIFLTSSGILKDWSLI